MASRDKLVEAILEQMTEMAVARSTVGAEPWVATDLTMTELQAIAVLRHRGPLRVGAIGEALGLSPNATTTMLTRLEERGLAERGLDRRDRRVLLVDLLPAGETLFDQLQAAGIATMRRPLDAMAVADLEALRRGMAALLAQIREEVPPCGLSARRP